MRRHEEPGDGDGDEDRVGPRHLAIAHRVHRILEFADDDEIHAQRAQDLRLRAIIISIQFIV